MGKQKQDYFTGEYYYVPDKNEKDPLISDWRDIIVWFVLIDFAIYGLYRFIAG